MLLREGRRKAHAGGDSVAHPVENTPWRRTRSPVPQNIDALQKRQAGAYQRSELFGEQQQVEGGDVAASEEPPWRRRPRCVGVGRVTLLRVPAEGETADEPLHPTVAPANRKHLESLLGEQLARRAGRRGDHGALADTSVGTDTTGELGHLTALRSTIDANQQDQIGTLGAGGKHPQGVQAARCEPQVKRNGILVRPDEL